MDDLDLQLEGVGEGEASGAWVLVFGGGSAEGEHTGSPLREMYGRVKRLF